MFGYFLTRLGMFIPTFLGVTLISFMFIRVLPGDPIIVMAGERGMTEERYQEMVEKLGWAKALSPKNQSGMSSLPCSRQLWNCRSAR